MTDAPPRVTAAALIAAVEAGQKPDLPRRMTPAERANMARAMQYFMLRDDLVVNEAGLLLGLRSGGMSHKCAAEIGLKSSATAIRRVKAAILAHISPEAAERGRMKRWGAEREGRSQKLAERDALDQRIHDMRLAGMRRARIKEELGISEGRLKDACDRMGPVHFNRPPSKWSQREREQNERAEARRRKRMELAAQLRELAKIMPVRHAAERIGITIRIGENIARQFGIRSAVQALPPRKAPGCFPKSQVQPRKFATSRQREPWVEDPSRIAPPNPRLTKAQQENVARMRRHGGWLMSGGMMVQPPSREEADRLIAEAIAAGRVTKCPTMFAAPVNNGEGL